jgi:hypothetical protein
VLHTLALRGSSERVDAMEEALEAARAEITGLSVLCVSRRLLTTASDLNEDNGVLQAACARMERESMEVRPMPRLLSCRCVIFMGAETGRGGRHHRLVAGFQPHPDHTGAR